MAGMEGLVAAKQAQAAALANGPDEATTTEIDHGRAEQHIQTAGVDYRAFLLMAPLPSRLQYIDRGSCGVRALFCDFLLSSFSSSTAILRAPGVAFCGFLNRRGRRGNGT